MTQLTIDNFIDEILVRIFDSKNTRQFETNVNGVYCMIYYITKKQYEKLAKYKHGTENKQKFIYQKDQESYVAINNTTNQFDVREFEDLFQAIKWLALSEVIQNDPLFN